MPHTTITVPGGKVGYYVTVTGYEGNGGDGYSGGGGGGKSYGGNGGSNGGKGHWGGGWGGDNGDGGRGTGEDIRNYALSGFTLSPGQGGQPEGGYGPVQMGGGGGGGVLVGGSGPARSQYQGEGYGGGGGYGGSSRKGLNGVIIVSVKTGITNVRNEGKCKI